MPFQYYGQIIWKNDLLYMPLCFAWQIFPMKWWLWQLWTKKPMIHNNTGKYFNKERNTTLAQLLLQWISLFKNLWIIPRLCGQSFFFTIYPWSCFIGVTCYGKAWTITSCSFLFLQYYNNCSKKQQKESEVLRKWKKKISYHWWFVGEVWNNSWLKI